MKKIFITKEQLNYLNEEVVNIAATAKGNSMSDFSNTVGDTNTQADINKASRVGDVNLTITGPNNDDKQPTQTVNVAPGDTPQNAIANQANDDLIRAGGAVKLSGDGFGESKVYSKKLIENARLDGIRKNGRIFSKKEFKNQFK
jgi:hypothetical protein